MITQNPDSASVSQTIGFVGTPAFDLFVVPPSTRLSAGSKLEVDFRQQIGGGPINAARQAQLLGAEVFVGAFVGPDELGKLMDTQLRREFQGRSLAIPQLQASRISVISDGRCLTSRPGLRHHHVSSMLIDELWRCSSVLIGPARDADLEHLLELISCLHGGTEIVLQLSADQLRQRDRAALLMNHSDLIVMNEREAQYFGGTSDEGKAFVSVMEECGGDLVVTSERGVRAWMDQNECEVQSRPVTKVVQTVGAGDVLTGTLLVARQAGFDAEGSVRLALDAAACHVSGQPMSDVSDSLRDLQSLGIRDEGELAVQWQ